MIRPVAIVFGMALLSLAGRADDSIASATVDTVKKATTYVRVAGDGWAGSGSGFVVAADEKGLIIATNHHVVSPKPSSESRPNAKPIVVTVVFNSGEKTEQSAPASIVALDQELDLAFLRVAGIKNAPQPLSFLDTAKPAETMPVYSFGFPFGNGLSSTKGNPAVTIGKASVSSLRNGPDGNLAFVQIDGNLNPGNSGGPVVDTQGRLVGVAVATIRDGKGIGLVIPATDLARTMAGRIGKLRVSPGKTADGSPSLRIEMAVVDPLNKIRSVTARYFVVPPKSKRPETASLEKYEGSKAVELKTTNGVAASEFPMSAAEGEVLVQVTADMDGKSTVSTKVQAFSLAPKVTEYTGTPPAGWKEYNPRDKSFTVWVPEKPESQEDKERTIVAKAQRYRVNAMVGKTIDGVVYVAESVVLPPAFMTVPRKDTLDLAYEILAEGTKGNLIEAKRDGTNLRWGTEYRSESGKIVTRARLIVAGARINIMRVIGTDEQVSSPEAETIFYSYRVPAPRARATPAPSESTPKPDTGAAKAAPKAAAKNTPVGKDPTILGGVFDPEFKDVAPNGTLLVGFEIGFVNMFKRDMIRSTRCIYRNGTEETFGEQRGTIKTVKTVKAKEGYAVGAVTVVHGMMFDGMSVTFMKVSNGVLDPTDSYESEWVGTTEKKKPTKLGGDGTPVVGIVGKTNAKEMTGMGLLFKGQEGFEPKTKK